MRGTKAKKIRKAVYGDGSQRVERQYVGGKIGKCAKGFGPGIISNAPGSPRALYQAAKKAA